MQGGEETITYIINFIYCSLRPIAIDNKYVHKVDIGPNSIQVQGIVWKTIHHQQGMQTFKNWVFHTWDILDVLVDIEG